jgi:hypothetical protein
VSGLSRTVVVLAVLEAGWLAFDGGRALLVGDYVTPRSGPHAGQLGSWSRLLSAAGLEPRSTPVKALHLVLGVTWLLMTVCVALGVRWAWWGMLGCAIATLWYLPLGTVLSAAQVALLLRH